ncbi:MAG TPA: alcohol dehydrogenase catalytic domain-containing protein [Chloroflexi bacterium]|nr:alcohol dehydrogenase catalytic domain-containing protein [Chloroflexota bacterium]
MIPETMRGVVFLGDRQVEVREFPVPRPGPSEVLVEMRTAAICGSDLHTYRRPKAQFEGMDPFIPGHEPAGVVAEIGSHVTNVKPGDRVTIYHYMACGKCQACHSGYLQHCEERRGLGQPVAQGPDADYIVVDARNCLHLPDALTFDDGAFIACIAGTAFSACRKLRVNGEDIVGVFGQGPVGLTGTVILKAMGATVVGIDIVDERLELASKLGVDAVINSATADVKQATLDLTDGRGFDAAFETSGSTVAQRAVVETLRVQGRASFVGLGSSEPSISPTAIIGRELTLMGSFVMPMGYYEDLVNLIVKHDLSPKFQHMITHRFPIERAEEAFRVADGGRAGKVVFSWD